MFPKTQIIETGFEGVTFYCRFESLKGPDATSLVLIEESMKRQIQANLSVQVVEMVGSNASCLFKDLKQPFLSESLVGMKGLVTLIKIGEYAGLLEAALPKEKGFKFRLVSLEDNNGILICGLIAPDEAKLKERVKIFDRLKRLEPKKSDRIGNYFLKSESGALIYLKKALDFRELLLNFFLEDIARVDLPEETDYEKAYSLQKACLLLGVEKVFSLDRGSDYLFTLTGSEGEGKWLNSSLQLIEKTARIFPFESQRVLGQIDPPPSVKDKRLRALWKTLGEWLKTQPGLAETYERVEDEASSGPFLQFFWLDPLERRILGPRISFLSSEASSGVMLQLFPRWDQLLLKLIECGSINLVESELKKKLES